MFSKQSLSSKLAVFLLVVMLGFLVRLKYIQWTSQSQIEKEKVSLKKQSDELQKQNEELTKSLRYLNSPDFKERVAREQLALKKDGEQVYTFTTKTPAQNLENQVELKQTNMEKWWQYFFRN